VVVAAVLMGEGHENATYDVTGPEALSLVETAERLYERLLARET
jgi:uncharacterized protein YbjT (DUF2867 family)